MSRLPARHGGRDTGGRVRNIRWLLALITTVHRFLYRASNGRIGSNLGGKPMLLLKTVGRRSGEPRLTPLLYVPDGERWLLVASNAGDDRSPGWWHNLEADPNAEIQVGTERHPVRARTARPEERRVLWPKLIAAYPPYADYEERTDREIPVVILERASAA